MSFLRAMSCTLPDCALRRNLSHRAGNGQERQGFSRKSAFLADSIVFCNRNVNRIPCKKISIFRQQNLDLGVHLPRVLSRLDSTSLFFEPPIPILARVFCLLTFRRATVGKAGISLYC